MLSPERATYLPAFEGLRGVTIVPPLQGSSH